MIKLVLIRSEGDVNGFFTLTMEDGSEHKGWSCDGGSIEWDDDKTKISEREHNRLFDLWREMGCQHKDQYKCHYALIDFNSRKVYMSWSAET